MFFFHSSQLIAIHVHFKMIKIKIHYILKKHIHEFYYIGIASELARFVFKKPLDTVVHAINDKLASPLETLKCRGVSVDRLLQHINNISVNLFK